MKLLLKLLCILCLNSTLLSQNDEYSISTPEVEVKQKRFGNTSYYTLKEFSQILDKEGKMRGRVWICQGHDCKRLRRRETNGRFAGEIIKGLITQ